MSLADMFTSPVRAPPPRSPPRSRSPSASPSRRRAGRDAEALFLSPGSQFASPSGSISRRRPRETSPAPSRRVGAGDAFTWSGDDEDEYDADGQPALRGHDQSGVRALPRLPPPLPPMRSYLDPAGADADAAFDPLLGAGIGLDPTALGPGAADDPDAPAGKKRRPVAKVDAERLLGARGFPALLRRIKGYTPRGKGHEARDLRDLMSVYQMWCHGMFPKGDFRGTVGRVEAVCRTRRMESAIRGYREAFYPPPESLEREADELNVDGEDDAKGDRRREGITPPRRSPPDEHGDRGDDELERSASRPSQRGLSDPAAEEDEEDEEDMERYMNFEQEEGGDTTRTTQMRESVEDEEDMDELMAMREMEAEW